MEFEQGHLKNAINIDVEAIKSVMYAGIGIYVVYSIILYWLGQKYINKGVNVE